MVTMTYDSPRGRDWQARLKVGAGATVPLVVLVSHSGSFSSHGRRRSTPGPPPHKFDFTRVRKGVKDPQGESLSANTRTC